MRISLKENHEKKITEAKIELAKARLNLLKEAGYTTFTNHIGELDSYYDPYKSEPQEVDIKAQNAATELAADNYSGKAADVKGSTDELIKKYKELRSFIYRCENTDYLHDIKHDGDYDGYYEETRKYKDAKKTVQEILVKLAESGEEISDPQIAKAVAKTVVALEQKKAKKDAFIANLKKEEEEIAKKVKEDPLAALVEAWDEIKKKDPSEKTTEEQLEWLQGQHILDAETGLFFEKKGWGYLKQFLWDKEYGKSGFGKSFYKKYGYWGKVLKQIWLMQFK